jgi:protein TonB
MLIPHETFSLWLILSLGIHVATLVFWPLPPSWKVDQPSYVVVDLRPAGGPAGAASASPSEKTQNTLSVSSQPNHTQKPLKTPTATSAIPKKIIKKPSIPRVIPVPKALPTELSTPRAIVTDSAKSSQQDDLSTQVPTSVFEGLIEGAQQDETSSNAGEQTGGAPGGQPNANNGIPGSGTGGPGTGQGTLRATPLGYGDNPPMPYPHSARRRGWEGDVLLRVDVSASGKVLSAHIESSSGYGILDDTALQTVTKWRFRPASINGTPKADTVLVPVHFQLHNPQ